MTLVQTFCIAALICSDIRVTTLSSCESRARLRHICKRDTQQRLGGSSF
jgi:hypothetical protein